LGHLITVCVLFLIGIFGVYQAQLLPLGNLKHPGPGFFPFLISCVLCSVALISLVSLKIGNLHKTTSTNWPTRSIWVRISFSLFLFTGYALVLERLGFLLSTSLLIGSFVKIVFKCSWLISGLFTAITVAGSYILFVWFLGVRLPSPNWW